LNPTVTSLQDSTHLKRQWSRSPLLALALGLVLTLVIWTLSEYDRTRTAAQRVADGADRIAQEMDRSLRLLEQSLRMTAAGVLWRTSLDDKQWTDFADRLQLPGLTPGAVTGLGFAPRQAPRDGGRPRDGPTAASPSFRAAVGSGCAPSGYRRRSQR
jgi:hypothetical protein